MRTVHRFIFIIIAILTVVGLSASLAQAGTRTHAGPAAVKVTSGHILVTAKGMTLYVFAPDKPKVSTCYATCAKFWPPLLVASSAQPPATMAGLAGTFGTTARKDGSQQLTYDGAPLYTFLEDKKPGDMKGQGLVASGGYWWVVVAPSTAAPTSTSSGSGGNGGYGNGGGY